MKPHKCQECNLSYVEHSTLAAHFKVHRPFPHIWHCGNGFYQIKDLTTHERLVHTTLQPRVDFTEPTIKSEFALKPKKTQTKLQVKKTLKLQTKRVKLSYLNMSTLTRAGGFMSVTNALTALKLKQCSWCIRRYMKRAIITMEL